ncbi:hypothetical protein [Mitsuaria sp. GD03876]|uniref:hypothetical protein n=1 Tax=Mitsuaria sp. GD03876 TaxID=2975399 RepID=UPI00244A030F|nr:hypothetical protein [Mitsuaria sp. GD03876]MDH0863014.1 hypothetical protein [Mitsuaria sp. GD03876]
MKFDTPRKAARIVAKRLEADGHVVMMDPDLALVPFSLNGYLPDLLAWKDGRHLIVDVSFPGRVLRAHSMRPETAEIHRHPGWDVLFCIVSEGELFAESSSAMGMATWEEIEGRLSDIDRLGIRAETAGFIVPALWTALLQFLKMLLHKDGEKVEGCADLSVLTKAYSLGYISHGQFQTMQYFLSTRNAAVHGLDFQVTPEDCQDMRDLISELATQMAIA